jgi:hypothetical protein
VAFYRGCGFGDATCASCEDVFPSPIKDEPLPPGGKSTNVTIVPGTTYTTGCAPSRWLLWLAVGFGIGFLVNK